MFGFTNFWLFFAASWALIIAPGPDMLYVITRGVSQGRRAGLLSAMGVTTGILVHTLAATLGLAVLLSTSAIAFLVVKYVGAVYLVYLGIKALKDNSSITLLEDDKRMDARSIMVQGMLSNVLNPKVALFFLAFLPQFVNQAGSHTALQMLSLGLMFAFFGVVYLTALAYFAGSIGNWLSHRHSLTHIIRWVTGAVLIGLGLRLAFVQKR